VGRNGKRLLSWSKLDCIDRGVNKKIKGVKNFKQLAYYVACLTLTGGLLLGRLYFSLYTEEKYTLHKTDIYELGY
jgi:hypothetical protein